MSGLDVRRRCQRCDWRYSTADDDLLEPDVDPYAAARLAVETHSAWSGHPTCRVCARSLTIDEQNSCGRCITRVRDALTDIVDLCAMAADELGHDARRDYSGPQSKGGGDDVRISTVLVLLGPAGGNVAAPPPRFDKRGRLIRDDAGWTTGHGMNLPTDPESIASTLGSWEDDWRRICGEPAAPFAATVTAASSYLLTRLTWAGRNHPAFADFAADIRRIVAALEAVTARGDRPNRSDVACFNCGQKALAQLVRDCRHEPPKRGLVTDPETGRRRLEGGMAWRARVETWHGSHGCDAGRSDMWDCLACGQRYTPAQYWIAVRSQLEARAADEEEG